MESDTNNKWTYAIVVLCSVVACIGLALHEATLLGWL